MHPNWHEFAADSEHAPAVAGKTVRVLLPEGSRRSATVTVLPLIGFGLVVRRWLAHGLTLGAAK